MAAWGRMAAPERELGQLPEREGPFLIVTSHQPHNVEKVQYGSPHHYPL